MAQIICSTIKTIFGWIVHIFGHAARSLLLDLPIWTCFAALCLTWLAGHLRDKYWVPQLQLETWTEDTARWDDEYTYYGRRCTVQDQTAFSIDDPELLFQPDDTPEQAKNKMLKHGVTMYPNLLSDETAQEVRNFIVKQNRKKLDAIYVLENENRFSFGIQVDQDPAVAQALSEILHNQRLVAALEAIMGPDPAIIEFTGITATYGAQEQGMHADVIPDASAQSASRNFVPSYSLFIPLQNTTREMGATHICPGTHMCGSAGFCSQSYISAAGDNSVWPAGWGALVNQQLQHRGAAHTDPNGAERVVFILTFAPRPRWSPKAVETRILGGGGSYSLHWSQWGHVLSDFAKAPERMAFPWRHLRSLGLYKPRHGSEWGWDFWTVTYQRIAREELGYSGESFLDADVDWIPEFLRGPMSLYRDFLGGETDSEYETVWEDFAQRVVANAQSFAQEWYQRVAATFVGVVVLANVLLVTVRRRTWLWRPFRRILFGHLIIAATVWLYQGSLEQSIWARNIRQKSLFNVFGADYSHFPDLPSVLANDEDIVLTHEFRSDYLSSFAEVLDHTHRTNVWWRERVQNYAEQYDDMSPSIQDTLCQRVLEEVSQQRARFLTKNSENGWGALPEPLALRYIHKSLLSQANPFVGFVVIWTENLISEYQFGYWRNNLGMKKLGVSFLSDLQSKLLSSRASHRGDTGSPQKRNSGPKREQLPTPVTTTGRSFRQRIAFPLRPSVKPPHTGAWLQVGDVVEGKYRGQFDEWYKGTIIAAVTSENAWNVEYEDGEIDEGLCRQCVRPFVPFQVGELVQYKDHESEQYIYCQIAQHHVNNNMFDVELDDGDRVYGVFESELRRGQSQLQRATSQWQEGDHVVSYKENDDEGRVFISVVERVLKSGFIQVRTRGGVERKIHESNIAAAVLELRDEVSEESNVVAKFPGAGESLYRGVVEEVLEGGMYSVEYEDGTSAVIDRSMIVSGTE